MPNRIIKESAFTSDSIARLTDFQFRLWVGLITQADNIGRGDARPAIIKGRIFALREKVRESDIKCGLEALAANGSISLYEVAGKPFYEFPKWKEHQRLRNEVSKFPGPEEKDDSRRASPQPAATRRELPPEYECELEEELEGELEGEDVCPELPSSTVLTLLLNDGSEYPVTQDYVDEMQELYAGVDVAQELKKMKAWCINNPKRRKTKNGIKAFIGNWLGKEQNRGSGRQKQITTFMDI